MEMEREEIDAKIGLLKVLGPNLRRPHADTLNGSDYSNMKELRGKTARSVLRVAFAFDPLQTAILLVGGSKSGVSERHFYKQLITKADALYRDHLAKLKKRKPHLPTGEGK
jgi:hypothetical protein